MQCDLCKQRKRELVRIGVPGSTLVVCKECAADVYINLVGGAAPDSDTSQPPKPSGRSRKSGRGGK